MIGLGCLGLGMVVEAVTIGGNMSAQAKITDFKADAIGAPDEKSLGGVVIAVGARCGARHNPRLRSFIRSRYRAPLVCSPSCHARASPLR